MKFFPSYISSIFFFLTFHHYNGFCQQATSEKTIPSKPNLNELDAKIARWQKDLNIPNVAVSIIENNSVVKTKVYGNLNNGEPAPKNMIFEVASLTKVVFSTLVLKLVEKGEWSLDEPLAKYFTDPEVAVSPFSKKITTRHILSQQSGFDNWRWMNPSGKLMFNFEPGTKFNYSGEGMEYLRSAIEQKFHKSLSKLSDSLLFKPLNMSDTNHGWDGKKNFERYARMYDADGIEIKKTDYSIQASAAAGLTTTIGDLSKFAIEVLKGTHLSKSLYKEMIKTQAVINPNLQQGLGWRIINGLPNNEYALQHGGNDPGVAAIIVLLPKSKRGIIVLTNADNGLIMCNNIVRATFPEGGEIIHKAYKSTKLNEVPSILKLSDSVIKMYEGKYKREDGVEVTVALKDNGLVLRMSGIPLLNLLPQSPDNFFLMDLDATVFFTKNTNGTINAVSIKDGGNVIKCLKITD
ncbi:serine hydrolase [Pedobacter foliorum]|uniref:serine hydrolase n=1 Tax=Pedobacter foliorum TaxID=2739058 RepID=UPI0015668A89|nr:serine hydrolase [Pedobacter foliorum]NRF37720.1 serine hydrolase [Pedobacter foliorum]